MTQDEVEERRRHPRVAAECEAWLWIGDVTLRCPIINLSEGGLQVRLPLRLGHGAVVDLTFDLGPKHGTVRGQGRIAWSSGLAPPGGEATSHVTGLELTALLDGEDRLHGYLLAS